MCGLFGFAGTMDVNAKRTLLRALCLFNTSRGDDSIGLASVRPDRSVMRYRACVAPIDGINAKRFIEVCDDQGNVHIGHTRWATHGSVSKRNAHPFHIGNVVGAHNGMVTVDKALRARCDGKNFPVDSQYLFYLLNRDGAIGAIRGSAALTFVELKSAYDVSLLRHNNPLHIALLNGDTGIAWASEREHLWQGLALAGIEDYTEFTLADGDRLNVSLNAQGHIADMDVIDNGIDGIMTSGVTCGAKPMQSAEDAQEHWGDALKRLAAMSELEQEELAADWNCSPAELRSLLRDSDDDITYRAWEIQ